MLKPSKEAVRQGRGAYEERTWAPDFAGSGRRGAGRYRVFVPDPVGGLEPELSASTSALSERAGAAVRRLNESSAALRSFDGLAGQLLRSEALASSAIEGLQISQRKLARAEIDGNAGEHKAREILGNVLAMRKAMQIDGETGDWTANHVLAIHREIAIVPPLDRIAGMFREEQGWIGGVSPLAATFVPPPHEFVPGLVEDLCDFMNRDDLSPVAQAAIAHAQFETIHPFGDGNGRVGRCLIHVLLRRRGLAPRYVPPVSLVLAAEKNAYIAGLEDFRRDRIDRWVAQFARAVEESAEMAAQFSECVGELQAEWLERAVPLRADATARLIIGLLPSYPIVTAAVVERATGRSRVAAIDGLEHLHQAGILKRRRNQRRGDSWEAGELLSLLAEFEAALQRRQAP
ncbi:MAG TPA: Fic family protein [Solirubrobacterales bacterium]|nr:Fic family protein [Solirubrobacterales bacterium]